jgi:PAS domain S-box-containing protein
VLLYLLIKRSLNTLSRSEAELKATSARLETALKQLTFHVENSPLAVIEWDNHFRVRRWSRRAEQLFGWTAEEVKGKNPLEIGFVYADDVAIVEQVIDRLLIGNQPRSVNRNRNYTRDGRVIHCEWYESTLFDDAAIGFYFITGSHVTARRGGGSAERVRNDSSYLNRPQSGFPTWKLMADG